jgi:hypothetical protein
MWLPISATLVTIYWGSNHSSTQVSHTLSSLLLPLCSMLSTLFFLLLLLVSLSALPAGYRPQYTAIYGHRLLNETNTSSDILISGSSCSGSYFNLSAASRGLSMAKSRLSWTYSSLTWDSDNYSCAYDALYTILYEIWSSDHKHWLERFKGINKTYLKHLAVGFKKFMQGKSTFEMVRDDIRKKLHSKYKEKFPYGTVGTSVAVLTAEMLCPQDSIAFSYPTCLKCDYKGDPVSDRLSFMLSPLNEVKSTSSWLSSMQHETHERCPNCKHNLKQPIYFNDPPHILAFDVNSLKVKLSKEIRFVDNGKTTILALKGVMP